MIAEGKTNKDILEYLVTTNTYYDTRSSSMSDFLKLYAYIDEEFLDGSGWIPPAGYYPPSRPWHIGATRVNGRVYQTDPYVDAETGGMCITFSQQVFDAEGKNVGIVALDIKLDRVTYFVSTQEIVRDGYGILLDDKMNIVVHDNPGLVGHSMSEACEGYSILADMMESSETISAARIQDNGGEDSVAFFRTIFNGWKIGIIIPRSSYYEHVISMGFVLSILGLGLAVALSYILVRTRVEKIRSEEANVSKSEFLARMSHEMRTPMNAVIGMAEIAKSSDDPNKIDYCLSKISGAANHLLGVINDVLDMSKIEAGKLELDPTEFLFQDMIDQIAAVIEIKIEEKNQKFSLNIAPDIPKVIIADRQRLTQVITNLLGNANKFTPECGIIHLFMSKETEPNGSFFLRVEVKDTGIGISEEQQKRLFQSFEQADGSTSRKYGGTGLGLAISKRIVNLMDGEIWVESELGKGASFIFTASITVGNQKVYSSLASTSLIEQDTTGTFVNNKILLAEDVEINQEIVLTLLEPTGIKIDCAKNGNEAIRMFMKASGQYDAIFMDLQMPEMDGYEATRTIRNLDYPNATTIPIIAMTANVFKEDVERCLEAGMNDHIGKPINHNELLSMLSKYLS
jgi:signal transduction histidine kinase/CheY-like chemotaxis protein